jgi:hypothetical protein
MPDPQIGKSNVGRIAERIVANELDYRGFTVRDLNLEGLAANVDLLAVDGNGNAWQIQVKGSTYDTNYPNNGWWFQYGYCTEKHIHDSNEKMFNRHEGSFKANIVALVCVRSPNEYQCIFLRVEDAEKAAQENLKHSFRMMKSNGFDHKPGKVWFSLFHTNSRTQEKQDGIERELTLLRDNLIDWQWDPEIKHFKKDTSGSSTVFDKVFELARNSK